MSCVGAIEVGMRVRWRGGEVVRGGRGHEGARVVSESSNARDSQLDVAEREGRAVLARDDEGMLDGADLREALLKHLIVDGGRQVPDEHSRPVAVHGAQR